VRGESPHLSKQNVPSHRFWGYAAFLSPFIQHFSHSF